MNARAACVGVAMVWLKSRCGHWWDQEMEAEQEKEGVSTPLLGEPGNSVQYSPPPSSSAAVNQKCRVYPGRFYVLMVLTFLALHQNIAWMTFGTIPTESFKHFGLTDDDIAIIAGKTVYNT